MTARAMTIRATIAAALMRLARVINPPRVVRVTSGRASA